METNKILCKNGIVGLLRCEKCNREIDTGLEQYFIGFNGVLCDECAIKLEEVL